MKGYVFAVLIIMAFAMAAHAQLYKWTDENGVVHYSNTKPPETGAQVEKKNETKSGYVPSTSNKLDRALNTYKATGIDPDANVKARSIKAKVSIGDWHSRLNYGGSYYYVDGSVRNISGEIASRARVKVKAIGDRGDLVSIDEGRVDPSQLRPGQDGTFQVIVRNTGTIKRWELTVLWQ